MGAIQYHNGYTGTAFAGTQELSIISWNVNPTTGTTEFKTSKSGGFVIRETNFKDCTVSIVIEYDFGNAPFKTPSTITLGTTLTDVQLFLHQTVSGALDGPKWQFSALVVDATPQSLAVDGKIQTTISMKGAGAFYSPS